MNNKVADYKIESASLMRQIEEITHKPNIGADDFRRISSLASNGVASDPIDDARKTLLISFAMTPCMCVLVVMFAYMASWVVPPDMPALAYGFPYLFSVMDILVIIAVVLLVKDGFSKWKFLKSRKNTQV